MFYLQVRAVDLLHKAAFRRGLGNSLFISPKKIGKISSESLQHYAGNNLAADRCAITVVGDNLVSFVCLFLIIFKCVTIKVLVL